jgi:putative addiction module component (TIGR02574 family)
MQGVENPPPGFEELTPSEKVEYIAALWDRIAEKQDDLPLSSWQRELAHARLVARQGDSATLTWSQVRSELESKLR